MRLHYLLTGTIGTVLLLSSPSLAAQFDSWRFDANENKLEIRTTGPVQPQAQLVFNPTRLVIDLPNTKFGQPQVARPIGGGVRVVRIGQFDPQTTRVVVEFNPGYTVDPQAIKFTPVSGSRWIVQLPKLERVSSNTPQDNNNRDDNSNYNLATIDSTQSPPEFSSAGKTQIEKLQTTGDGFFIRTSGISPQARINRSVDRTTIFMNIVGASLSPQLTARSILVNRHGVTRVQLIQLRTTPSTVQVSFKVDAKSPDWEVSTVGDGLVILPVKGFVNSREGGETLTPNFPDVNDVENNNETGTDTIESVQLSDNGTELLIKGGQKSSVTTGWDRGSAMFRISINNAKLAPQASRVNLPPNSPVLGVRVQSGTLNNVIILVQPASGVRIGQIGQTSNGMLSLPIQRTSQVRSPIGLPPLDQGGSNHLPDPNAKPETNPQPRPRRTTPKGKLLVMIDPGHGGKDPGAIGIAGVQEKDIILPISLRIAKILQENGVETVLTRDADYFVTLPGRVEMAQRTGADIFVSIHANSAGLNRPEVSGLETYYYDSGLDLARTVHNKILQNVNVRDRRVRKARFYVLRKNSIPSILVELGYLTGEEDVANLQRSTYQNQMAQAIAQGILQYLKQR
ncbi:N-acetylmuramoyl-L-alanine amidase [Cylindrospermopsis raciborskii]|uniref:N-acetylmuramoyl-L-alanine amidase n=1 Tax=Cylindrospermopsis raciborskii TaxID=77022 RepID=UPI003A8FD24F